MSEIQFSQINYNGDVTHDFLKSELLKEFNAPIEIKIKLKLNFREDIPTILKSMEDAVGGILTITTPYGFIVSGRGLFIDGIIDDVGSPFDSVPRVVKIGISGSVSATKELYTKLHKYVKTDEVYVHWYYKSSHGLDSIRFTIEDQKAFKAEHYPYINDASTYAQRFLASPACIMILLGDPGTGKTSLIRHILRTSGKEAYVTYDDAVMHEDSLYTSFLSDDDAKFLILEDADLILADRQRDGNRVMSKILNAADGLVSFDDKKIIFTANIRDINRIDEALMRPGRCFDIVTFRPLKGEEIDVACKANNIELKNKQSEMTLAEIFNQV